MAEGRATSDILCLILDVLLYGGMIVETFKKKDYFIFHFVEKKTT